MQKTIWTTRFLGTTRGRVLESLCYVPRTAAELAEQLRLTTNAVRSHLEALGRDGLVRQTGLRRGTRRPFVTYDLTPQGQRLFPNGYEPVLRELVEVLLERLRPVKTRGMLLEVGRRLAQAHLAHLRSVPPNTRAA